MSNGQSTTQTSDPARAAAIESRAYQLWLDEGMPDGRHLDHWVRAELELRNADPAPAAAGSRKVEANPGHSGRQPPGGPVRQENRAAGGRNLGKDKTRPGTNPG